MRKSEFIRMCNKLEKEGWSLLELQPEAKFARYIKNGRVEVVGVKK